MGATAKEIGATEAKKTIVGRRTLHRFEDLRELRKIIHMFSSSSSKEAFYSALETTRAPRKHKSHAGNTGTTWYYRFVLTVISTKVMAWTRMTLGKYPATCANDGFAALAVVKITGANQEQKRSQTKAREP